MRGSAYPTNTNDFGPSLVGLPLWPCDDLAECRFAAGMVQVARLGLTDLPRETAINLQRRTATWVPIDAPPIGPIQDTLAPGTV
jgi:hypothetical protein